MLDKRTIYTVRLEGESAFMELAIGLCMDEGQLCYYNFERVHMLDGRKVKDLPNGIVFKLKSNPFGRNNTLVFKPLTMDEFEERIRPQLPEELSVMLQDIDDVYFWYRKQAGIA